MYQQNKKQNFYGGNRFHGLNDGQYRRRPLHCFQDLEVYQKVLECSVAVAKQVDEYLIAVRTAAERSASDIVRHRGKARKGTGSVVSTSGNDRQRFGIGTVQNLILQNMLPCALGIPHQVAEAHSLRFGDHAAGIAAIEKAMLNCNKMIVYLEQFRDICVRPVRSQTPEASADAQARRTSNGESGIPWEFFDDAIKKYLYVRRKMLRLEVAWKKFMPEYKSQNSSV